MPRAAGRLQRAVAMSIVGLVWLMNVYRAATQSITHDEALTYEWLVRYPWRRIFEFYDPNHHVLHTILCKLSVGWFGLSEITLRAPSLAGGGLYLVTIFRLAELSLGGTALFLPAVAALTLHPYVLDFLSAARGYGLALGCLLAALDQLTRCVSSGPALPVWRLRVASVWLGLSVASNLAFLFPAAGLIGAFLVVMMFTAFAQRRARLARYALDLIVPAVLIAGAIVVVPVTHATRGQFYYGASTLNSMVNGLVHVSFLHDRSMRSYGEHLPGAWYLGRAVVLAAFCAGVLVGAAIIRRRSVAEPSALLILIEATMIGTLVLLKIAHGVFDLPYPLGRTALYWIPMLLLTIALLARPSDISPRWVSWPAWALIVFCILQFGRQLEVTYYADWPYDASTKHFVALVIFDRLGRVDRSNGLDNFDRGQHPRQDDEMRIGATWTFEPSLNFYRDRYRLTWIQPVERAVPSPGFDYYVLRATDRDLVHALNLRPIFVDDIGSVLAVPATR
jgi:hypothetical protein